MRSNKSYELTEVARIDADYVLSGLVDGMKENNYQIYDDIEEMPKYMRIAAETISVSYMILYNHNLGVKNYMKNDILKRQYIYEKGIVMLSYFMTPKGFDIFLDHCDREVNGPLLESNKRLETKDG
tara:strand:- start:54 stop:431 length:378 start_codon:yes stop_codon:yes gene_type:complete